ncbi:hypothetical protein L9F63_017832, partial [Diploptera punctata]
MWKKPFLLFAALVYVCESAVKPWPEPAPKRFIGSYKYFPDAGYYKFYRFKLPWGEAWTVCNDDNAHLVVINDEKELEAMKALLIESQVKDWSHFGVHDLFVNTHYITVDNKQFHPSSYNKWGPKEPSNKGSENCVSIHPNGLLRDNPCSVAQPFICEYEVQLQ